MGTIQPSDRLTQILILREVGGSRYFDATTKAALQASSLYIVRERLNGKMYVPPRPPPEPIPGDVIENLPVDKQNAAREYISMRLDLVRQAAIDMRIYEAAEKAVRDSNGELAYGVLKARKKLPGEDFQIEPLEG